MTKNQEVLFTEIKEFPKEALLELMNHPKVQKHLPVFAGDFDEAAYKRFISFQENLWKEKGYGIWAFTQNGTFIGWGGLQPVEHDVEIGLVLNPCHWGVGRSIFKKMVQYAFEQQKLQSVIALFAPSRNRTKGIKIFGFQEDGTYDYHGKPFTRYRLSQG